MRETTSRLAQTLTKLVRRNQSYSDSYAKEDMYKLRNFSRFQRKHIVVLCAVMGEYLLESDSCSMEQVSTTLGKYDHHLVQYILEQLTQKESKAATKDMIRNLGKGIKKNQAAFYRMKHEGNQLMKGVPARKLSHIISTQQWPK